MENIAHVGWTKSPEDLERLVLTVDYLDSIGAEDETFLKPVFFDLSQGRDFLKDGEKYKVIVLHFIFRGGFYVNQGIQVKNSPLRVSELSSWVSWRKRLEDSGADYIIAFRVNFLAFNGLGAFALLFAFNMTKIQRLEPISEGFNLFSCWNRLLTVATNHDSKTSVLDNSDSINFLKLFLYSPFGSPKSSGLPPFKQNSTLLKKLMP